MRDVRKIILEEGIAVARRLASSSAERVSIEAAWAMMNQAEGDIAYASELITTLPHKGGARMKDWARETDGAGTYLWIGGCFRDRPMGVPFGAKSRMSLLHLFNEAIRANSRTVTIGSSMYEWARTVSSHSLGGMTYSMVAEHSMRIAAASLAFEPPPESPAGAFRAPIVERLDFKAREAEVSAKADRPHEIPVWMVEFPEAILLSEEIFELFRASMTPVRSSALQQISNNSAAVDLYIGLASRLPVLSATAVVDWSRIAATFGSGYKNARQLKPAVQDVLQLVSAVYPEAQVEIGSEGLILHPSPPPIDRRPTSQAAA